jgi:G:T-mismatch repair DNA endonuclease (very short patch repair protein)
MERDRLNREDLEALGWMVIEIWEHEIRETPAAVVRRIRLAVLDIAC